MGTPILEFQNVTHVYNPLSEQEWKSLAEVSFSVEKGEFLAILGHNGSGKSTLAKHMNALLLPTEGTVLVKGIPTGDEKRVWDVRQIVGMVFQNPDNQIVATTVEEDVAFGPENLGIPPKEIRRRVEEALDAVGLREYRFSSPHQLSGGQKQRVAIAGMIALRPEVIVLDEPTAMLDPLGRKEVMRTVLQLNQEGITIVYITHCMEEVIHAQRVLVMEQGKIALTGTPKEVFSQVQVLNSLHLDVPPMTAVAHGLRALGLLVPPDILTLDEMVKCLCP